MNPKQGKPPETDLWRRRLEDLGMHWRWWAEDPGSHEDAVTALRERVKELNCLFAISQLTEREDCSFEDFLGMVVDILPPSWQFPDVACARIVMNGHPYDSLHFQRSIWHLSAPITIKGDVAGEVVVYYKEACPDADEGPFLREERHLIDAVAERMGHIAVRKTAEARLEDSNRQLEIERTALREANSALREVLNRIEEEKSATQQGILENVSKIILPIVHELAANVTPAQKDYLKLLEENLEQITSPFVHRLAREYQSLTTTETRICAMIRSGLGSKEIARLRGVSLATISRHREHIRQKLGIANTRTNLATFLRSTM